MLPKVVGDTQLPVLGDLDMVTYYKADPSEEGKLFLALQSVEEQMQSQGVPFCTYYSPASSCVNLLDYNIEVNVQEGLASLDYISDTLFRTYKDVLVLSALSEAHIDESAQMLAYIEQNLGYIIDSTFPALFVDSGYDNAQGYVSNLVATMLSNPPRIVTSIKPKHIRRIIPEIK